MRMKQRQHSFGGLRHAWVSYGVLVVMLLLTVIASYGAELFSRAKDRARFDKAVEQTRESMQRLMNGYLILLDGLRGLANANVSMNPVQFHAYVDSLQLRQNYPGVQG